MFDSSGSPTTVTYDLDTLGISYQTISIFTWIVIAGMCQIVAIFGVITNIINIMCFIKQGFKEPVNISLLGLAVSDLGCVVTQIIINIFYTLAVGNANLSFDSLEVCYLAAAAPHLAFSRVNTWITALITLERCLCITTPLKVKNIVTPKRVSIIIICVYIIFIFSGSPVYAVNKLDVKYSIYKNRTLLGLVFTSEKEQVEGMTFAINNFAIPFIAFIIIITCTVVLVINLQKRIRWQKTSTTVAHADLSTRNQKVAKMVVVISTLFIVCFIPLAVTMLAVAFEPSLNLGGKFESITKMLGITGLLMESVNSSSNIFIYYYMSSKYMQTLRTILNKHKC